MEEDDYGKFRLARVNRASWVAIRCKKCIKIDRCFTDIIKGPSLVLFPPTPKSGSACHMTRLAIHRRHSVVIMSPLYILLCFSPLICCHISCVSVRSLRLSCRRSNTRRCPNVGLLLAHRLRRSADISRVLGDSVMFDAMLNVGQRHRRRANINPALASSSSYCTAEPGPFELA